MGTVHTWARNKHRSLERFFIIEDNIPQMPARGVVGGLARMNTASAPNAGFQVDAHDPIRSAGVDFAVLGIGQRVIVDQERGAYPGGGGHTDP